MCANEELESAAKFPDAGAIFVTDAERGHQDDPQGPNVALRRLLKMKGLPMCGTSYPVYHPDFIITMLGDAENKRTIWRWRRRVLAPVAIIVGKTYTLECPSHWAHGREVEVDKLLPDGLTAEVHVLPAGVWIGIVQSADLRERAQ